MFFIVKLGLGGNSINILIIEDDNNKSNQIIGSIFDVYSNRVKITEAHSYQKGMKKIRTEIYDCLLLDMTLPSYDIDANHSGGETKKFGGIEILTEMQFRNIFLKTIIITQFDTFGDGENLMTIKELGKKLRKNFPDNFVEIIYYNSSLTTWRDQLIKILDVYEKGDKP